MRYVFFALLLISFITVHVSAQENLSPERSVARAKVMVDESDYAHAVPLLIDAMRRADNDEVKKNAREMLEDLGLTRQEIFQFDTVALTGDDWAKQLKRIHTTMQAHRREELEFDYAIGILNVAVAPRTLPNGETTVDIEQKDLARSLELLLKVALAEGNGDHAQQAQERLEAIGIFGPRMEVARKAVAEGKVPPEILNELACSVCVQYLTKYKEWSERGEDNDDALHQKAVATDRGKALYGFVKKEYGQTAVYKRATPVLNFWEQATGTVEDKKF